MRGALGCFIAVALICVPASAARAVPIEALNLTALTKASDVIAIGRVLSISDAGPTTISTGGGPVDGRRMTATFAADLFIKGDLQPARLQFVFVVPAEPLGYVGVKATEEAKILFLARRQTELDVASPYSPFLPAPGGPLNLEGNTALDRVADAIGQVLNDPSAEPRARADSLWALSTAESPMAIRALTRALEDHDRSIQLEAAGALLGLNSMTGLDVAEEALAHPDQNPSDGIQALRSGIWSGLKDSNAVPVLARLARLPEVETRRAAVRALRQTQSPSAIRALADGLDDLDPVVRRTCVLGLAETTGERPPYLAKSGATEDDRVAFWRDWARQRGLLR